MHRQIVHRSATQKELWFSYGISSKFWYTNNHDMLAKLACQGIGWALIPDEIALPLIAQGKLVALPVAHEKDGWLTTTGCLVSRCHSSALYWNAYLRNCNSLNSHPKGIRPQEYIMLYNA
ncbi:hypothetical protein [Photobacterium sanguinicancri]|uniref:hypothetical protein n=1 Tax=Photobacterium sanguinicancri TaxID=875932 RepID=UPI003D10784F